MLLNAPGFYNLPIDDAADGEAHMGTWTTWLASLALLLTAAGAQAQGRGSYNGKDGPQDLQHITHAGAQGQLCWIEWDAQRNTSAGRTRCGRVGLRACGPARQPCDPDNNQLCVGTDGAVRNPADATAEACRSYVPDTIAQSNLAGFLQTVPPPRTGALPWPVNCTPGVDCDVLHNPGAQLSGVVFRPNTSLATGAPLLLDGVPCRHRVDCIAMANGRVFGHGPSTNGARLQPDWTQLPAQALAIAVGANGHLWAIAPNRTLWRWNGSGWTPMPGAADRVAVDPAGNAWVVNRANNGLYLWNGSGWTQVASAAPLQDVAIGKDGQVYAVAKDNRIFKRSGDAWTPMDGSAVRLAVDGNGVLHRIDSAGLVSRRQDGGWQAMALPAGRSAVELAAGGDQLFVIAGSTPQGRAGTLMQWNAGQWNAGIASSVGAATAVAVNARGEPTVVTPVGAVWRYGF